MSHPRFAPYAPLFDAFERAGHALYFVGGCVRDLVMATEDIGDIDLATSATPDAIKAVLKANGFRVIPLGERFGTISTLVRGVQVEITTFRVGEVYAPGSRHPDVVFGTDIRDDLERRDLSMNAMAMDRDGTILDPFDGQRAITEQRLEVPGGGYENTISILRDDPLRLLRIGRFAGRFGYVPTDETTAAARVAAPDLVHISHERWSAELDKLLVAAAPDVGLRWLHGTGALDVVLPWQAGIAGPVLEATWAQLALTRPVFSARHRDVWLARLAGEGARFVWAQKPKPALAALRELRWAVWLATMATGSANGLPDGGSEALVAEVSAHLRLSNQRRHDLAVLLQPLGGSSTRPALRREVRAGGRLAFLRLDAALARGGDAEALTARSVALRGLLDAEDPVPRLPRGLGAVLRKRFGLEGPEIGAAIVWVEEQILDGVLPNGGESETYAVAYGARGGRR